MKIQWKSYDESVTLPSAKIPSEAVLVNRSTNIFIFHLKTIPAIMAVTVVLVVMSSKHFYDAGIMHNDINNYVRLVIVWSMGFVGFVIHETIHAALYPPETETTIYHALKKGIMFCYNTCPISKRRYIVISVAPGAILGIIPFAMWLMVPARTGYIYSCAGPFFMLMILAGIGDFMNVVSVMRTVPNGAHIQFSGGQTFWYI